MLLLLLLFWLQLCRRSSCFQLSLPLFFSLYFSVSLTLCVCWNNRFIFGFISDWQYFIPMLFFYSPLSTILFCHFTYDFFFCSYLFQGVYECCISDFFLLLFICFFPAFFVFLRVCVRGPLAFLNITEVWHMKTEEMDSIWNCLQIWWVFLPFHYNSYRKRKSIAEIFNFLSRVQNNFNIVLRKCLAIC